MTITVKKIREFERDHPMTDEDYARARRQLAESLVPMNNHIAKSLILMVSQPHTLLGDFTRLTEAGWSNAEKLAAAERLVTDWMRITHFGRFPQARRALYLYAQQCGHSAAECLRTHLLPITLREAVERTRSEWDTPCYFKLTWDEGLYGQHFDPWKGSQWLTHNNGRRVKVALNKLPILFAIGWLFQQARSDVIDELTGENNAKRREKRRTDDLLSLVDEREPYDIELALRLVEEKDDVLRGRYPTLWPLERRVYALNADIGLKPARIAEHLGRGPESVRVHLYRARKKVEAGLVNAVDLPHRSPRGGQHEEGHFHAVPDNFGWRAC